MNPHTWTIGCTFEFIFELTKPRNSGWRLPSKRQTRRSGKKVLACAAKTNQPATPKKDQRTYQDRKEHHHKNRRTGERNISAYLSSEKISFQSSCLFNTHKKFGKSLS